ncbi:hypothetical protein TeGR_g10150, partial [Tetraparma gracilis]
EFSGRQLEAVPDSQISLLVSSLVAMIRSSSNLGLSAATWCAEFLPADDVVTGGFTRRLVVGICRAIQPALKLSRWGAFLRLVILLAMQYQDIVTDVLVGLQFIEEGRGGDAKASFTILGIAVFCHVLLAYFQHRKKSPKELAMRLLAALFMLTPLVESYSVWTGAAKAEGELVPPMYILIVTRIIELIIESFPESILQLNIALSDVNSVSNVMIFSILSSVASASAIMTDTSISFELGVMNKQDRGSDSHPFFGLVPAKKKNLVLLYAGFFIFHAGYMASSLLTLTACTMAGVNMGFVALYFAAETGAMFINLERTGRSYACVSTSRTTSSIMWLEFYEDPALSAEIAAHFETMKAALAERKEERAAKKKKGDGKEAEKKVAHVSEEEQLKAKSREEVLELIDKSSTKEELDEIYTSLRKRCNVVT